MLVYGVDPGSSTGLAKFEHGRLVELSTLTPAGLLDLLLRTPPRLLVFEDSRLIRHTWARPGANAAAQQKIARNVGQIDAWCMQIEEVCRRHYIDFIPVSPKAKGAKISAKTFAQITGWRQKCNQHERDAALVGWQFRATRTPVRGMAQQNTSLSGLNTPMCMSS